MERGEAGCRVSQPHRCRFQLFRTLNTGLVIRPQLVHAFTHAALSPDPDLAIAALMIARVEHPRLDAGPYLDQLDALGREAQLRVAAAPLVPHDTPARVDPDRYARVLALNDYLFGELRFVGNEVHYEDPPEQFSERSPRSPHRHSDYARPALHGGGAPRRASRRRDQLSRTLPAALSGRRGLQYSEDLIIDAYHGGALLQRGRLPRAVAAPRQATTATDSSGICSGTPPSRRSSRACCST